MDIYLLIIEDRHVDVEVHPFVSEYWARIAAAKYLAECGNPEDWDEELTPLMQADGWIYTCTYSVEGDSLRIQKRKLDERG